MSIHQSSKGQIITTQKNQKSDIFGDLKNIVTTSKSKDSE